MKLRNRSRPGTLHSMFLFAAGTQRCVKDPGLAPQTGFGEESPIWLRDSEGISGTTSVG